MARFSEWVGRVFRSTDHQPLVAVFGNETWAGNSVTPSKALTLSTAWACIRLLTETMGGLPKMIVQTVPGSNGKNKIRLDDHDLMPVLTIKANRRMTPQEYMEAMMLNLLTWGNAYAEIERNSLGMVFALNPLLSEQMDVKQMGNGTIEYRYHTPKGVLIFGEDQILHVKLFGWSGIVGLSPIAHGAQSMGLALATEEFGSRFFGNGARPSGFLMTDKTLTAEQRIQYKKNFESIHEGLERSHKLALLEASFTYQAVSIPPNEAQFLETRTFQVPEVCRWYLVPPHKVMHLDKATFNNITQLDLEFWKITLLPYAVRFEQRERIQLLPPDERLNTRIRFDMENPLRTDALSRTQVQVMKVQNGIESRNEVRAQNDMNPHEGADDLTVQQQMISLEDLDRVNRGGAVNTQGE